MTHGRSPLARFMISQMSLPDAGSDIPVRLSVRADANGERWQRQYANSEFNTYQTYGEGGVLIEVIGALQIVYRLVVVDGALHYEQLRAALRVGPVRVPLPRLLLPLIQAQEWREKDQSVAYVRVNVSNPLAGEVISYHGWLQQENQVQ